MDARAVLAEVVLEGREDALAQELSGGQRKLLELGRALTTDTLLVLLDEVGAGVASALRRALTGVVARLLARHGRGFLLIEHNMGLVARLWGWRSQPSRGLL